jgi:hypothetical protein
MTEVDIIAAILRLIRDGGAVVTLIGILYGGYRGWWVWGYQYKEVKQDRDEWKSFALASGNLARRAVTIAETSSESRQVISVVTK